MKPMIRKSGGRWWVHRPGYGFNPTPSKVSFGSWKEAVTSLRSAPASAGAMVERGYYGLGLNGKYGWSRRGTIRMEAM